jgi:hypothetical protein
MPGNSFSHLVTEDRRLVILRVLSESGGYSANEYLVNTMLANFGHQVGRDRLRNDLSWLEEQELIELKVIGDVYISTLKARGQDVAEGKATCVGVKRPTAGY